MVYFRYAIQTSKMNVVWIGTKLIRPPPIHSSSLRYQIRLVQKCKRIFFPTLKNEKKIDQYKNLFWPNFARILTY